MRRGPLIPLALLCLPLTVFAQAPPPPDSPVTLKTEVRVVLVDVVVTQRNGKPLQNLPRDVFQVFEDNRPQSIAFFEEHKPAPPTAAPLPSLPPNTYSNSQPSDPSGSTNVLLLDWLNTQPQDRRFVQSQIASYLRHAPPGARIAVFVLTSQLWMLKEPTSDSSALLAALGNPDSNGSQRASPLLDSASRAASEDEMVRMMTVMQVAPAGLEAVRSERGDFGAARLDQRVATTLRAFEELGRYLSGIPGRKNIVWFSGAFPIDLFPGRDAPRQYARQIKRVTDFLAEARVSLYPVSTTGLGQDAAPSVLSAEIRPPDAAGSIATNQIAMESLAKGTGGRAFYNTNGIGEALSRAVDTGTHFYTLTYSPANPAMDGKFRTIKVKVLRRGARVSARLGYYASDPLTASSEKSPPADPLPQLTRLGMPDVAQIPYTVSVALRPTDPASPASTSRRYLLDFHIPVSSLKLQLSPDGVFRDSLTAVVSAFTFDTKPIGSASRKFDVALSVGQYAETRDRGLHMRFEFDAPPGDLLLRTGLSEKNTLKLGTLGIAVSEATLRAAANSASSSAIVASAEPAPLLPASAPAVPTDSAAAIPSPLSAPLATLPASADSSCRLADILPPLSAHISELLDSMNRFTATELLERDRLDTRGNAKSQFREKSNYVVTIRHLGEGEYEVQEFRGSGQTPPRSEGTLATSGSPVLALIFHPSHLEEFDMSCDGPVEWRDHSAWLVHFRQRSDRPATISGLEAGARSYDLQLAGTAWVDVSGFQLLHLDVDLLQPIPEESLDQLHQSIDYAAVAFAARKTTLWLPQFAEITAQYKGQRYRDRHTYSDFRLFAIDTGQKISVPAPDPE